MQASSETPDVPQPKSGMRWPEFKPTCVWDLLAAAPTFCLVAVSSVAAATETLVLILARLASWIGDTDKSLVPASKLQVNSTCVTRNATSTQQHGRYKLAGANLALYRGTRERHSSSRVSAHAACIPLMPSIRRVAVVAAAEVKKFHSNCKCKARMFQVARDQYVRYVACITTRLAC